MSLSVSDHSGVMKMNKDLKKKSCPIKSKLTEEEKHRIEME